MLVTIGGKRWNMVFSSVTDCAGKCDPPDKKNKHIKLAPSLKKDPEDLLRVIVHEALHAADWSKAEEWAEQTSQDIARILWKVGYRLTEPREL